MGYSNGNSFGASVGNDLGGGASYGPGGVDGSRPPANVIAPFTVLTWRI